MSDWLAHAIIGSAAGLIGFVLSRTSWRLSRRLVRVPMIDGDIFAGVQNPPIEVWIKHGEKWLRYTRHDAVEADANNQAWRKSDGE